MIPEASSAATLGVSVVLHNSCPTRLAATLCHLHASLCLAIDSDVLRAARVTIVDNDSTAAYRRELPALCAACLDAADGAPAAAGQTSAIARRRAAIRWNLVLEATNRGFGAGHNRGQRDADEDYLLILNPDVELAPAALREGLAWLQNSATTVAINPRCARAGGAPEYLCKRYPSVVDLFLRGFGGERLRARFRERLARYEYRDRAEADSPWPAELLSGACLICRRHAFEACAGFDPGFFLYFEDFDLSRRMATLGELQCLPAMAAVHHGGEAARKGWRHRRWFIASALRFFARHGWRLR
jgi:GT2 family glycosyltransferase